MNRDQKIFLGVISFCVSLFVIGFLIGIILGEKALQIYVITILSIVIVILFSYLIWYGYKLLGDEDPFAI